MTDYITLAGFILAVFGTGVAVGKFVEKIERLDRKQEDEEHSNTSCISIIIFWVELCKVGFTLS